MTDRLKLSWFLAIGGFTAFAFVQFHPIVAFFFWFCLYATLFFITTAL